MIELMGMSSPNVRKIVIALEEMGLAYKTTHVSVFRAQQFEEAFLTLNPMAKVPVLFDRDGPAGEMPIFESGAILLYLAEVYGPTFLPREGPQRYEVLKWLFMQVANVGPAMGNHGHMKGMAAEEPYGAGRFRRMSAQVFRAVERRLEEAGYLGGAAYSIADMASHPWMRRFKHFGLPLSDFPHLCEWVATISARPAVKRADAIIKRLGEKDSADIAAASDEEMAMFRGLRIEAPSAEEAGRMPPWWKPHRSAPLDSAEASGLGSCKPDAP